MQITCVWWRDTPSPSMKKPVLCHVRIHFNILLFIINLCFFSFSFELVQTSAWFSHYDLNKIFNVVVLYLYESYSFTFLKNYLLTKNYSYFSLGMWQKISQK